MHHVLLQMAGLVAAGVAWRHWAPLGLSGDEMRRALTGLVYVLLLPALVLGVLWEATLGLDSLRIAAVAAGSLLLVLAMAWAGYRAAVVPKPAAGALILAAAFPNVTYLGLPVLEQTLGEWARSVAIQYDLFACTPLLLSLGMLVGRLHGDREETAHPLRSLVGVPALWAALAAVALNLTGVPPPAVFKGWLGLLAGSVVPLMLFSLGLGLRWDSVSWRAVPLVTPVIVLQLAVMPVLAWGLAYGLGLHGPLLTAVVLEAAMPSMVLGVVICDRYGLDTGLYAMVVSLSTALSVFTLPVWMSVLA
jgi:hypothetical protein